MSLRNAVNDWLQQSPQARRLRLAYLRAARELDRRAAKATTLNLALQGGGVLGAFTWGILDRLSHERSLEVKAVTGASAGALNGALFISGLMTGGGAGARHTMKSFWRDIASASTLTSFLPTPMALNAQADLWRQMFTNPGALSANPLRGALEKHVDIDALRAPEAPALFVSATHVQTAKARIFTKADISIDALLASACLPNIHPTVWIDGEPYWDGGFSANPPLAPLTDMGAERTLLARLIRSGSLDLPKSGADVDAYMKNLLFNQSLDDELAHLAGANPGLSNLELILFSDYDHRAQISRRPTPVLIDALHEKGRVAAEDYLEKSRRGAQGRSDSEPKNRPAAIA